MLQYLALFSTERKGWGVGEVGLYPGVWVGEGVVAYNQIGL